MAALQTALERAAKHALAPSRIPSPRARKSDMNQGCVGQRKVRRDADPAAAAAALPPLTQPHSHQSALPPLLLAPPALAALPSLGQGQVKSACETQMGSARRAGGTAKLSTCARASSARTPATHGGWGTAGWPTCVAAAEASFSQSHQSPAARLPCHPRSPVHRLRAHRT